MAASAPLALRATNAGYRSHPANRHEEVPVAVAPAHGFGRAAGYCSIRIVRAPSHQGAGDAFAWGQSRR